MPKGKGTANLPVQFDEELARMAQAYRAAEASSVSGNFISIKGGIMTYRGAPIEGNKFNGIILASVFENDYHPNAFDPDTPESPACYAFSKTIEGLKPHDESEKKEGDANGLCANCWANGFGSAADGGRGKACQNRRRIAVIPGTNLDAEAIAAAEIAYLRVPVLSCPGYANHVMQVSDLLKKPPFGVVTEISVVPDQKSMFRVLFKTASDVKDRGVLGALFSKAQVADKAIMFAYPKNTPRTATPRGRAKPPARGKPAARQAPPPAAAAKKSAGRGKPAAAPSGTPQPRRF